MTFLLVIHMLLALGIVGLVLLQRSEGGALGIGGSGGGGMGGLMGSREAATLLTRATAVFAALFFTTSIVLSILSGGTGGSRSILDDRPQPVQVIPADSTETDGAPTDGGQTEGDAPAPAAGVPLDE